MMQGSLSRAFCHLHIFSGEASLVCFLIKSIVFLLLRFEGSLYVWGDRP